MDQQGSFGCPGGGPAVYDDAATGISLRGWWNVFFFFFLPFFICFLLACDVRCIDAIPMIMFQLCVYHDDSRSTLGSQTLHCILPRLAKPDDHT